MKLTGSNRPSTATTSPRIGSRFLPTGPFRGARTQQDFPSANSPQRSSPRGPAWVVSPTAVQVSVPTCTRMATAPTRPPRPCATTLGGYLQSGATPPIGYPQANTTCPCVDATRMPSTMGGYGSNSHGTYSADPFNGAYGERIHRRQHGATDQQQSGTSPTRSTATPCHLLSPGATPEQIASPQQQGSMQRFDAFRNTMLNAFGTLGDESNASGR